MSFFLQVSECSQKDEAFCDQHQCQYFTLDYNLYNGCEENRPYSGLSDCWNSPTLSLSRHSVLDNYNCKVSNPCQRSVCGSEGRSLDRIEGFVLTLNAPITTKVVCFLCLLKCLRSLYDKQCGPRSDCSYIRSSLFWVHAVCFYA